MPPALGSGPRLKPILTGPDKFSVADRFRGARFRCRSARFEQSFGCALAKLKQELISSLRRPVGTSITLAHDMSIGQYSDVYLDAVFDRCRMPNIVAAFSPIARILIAGLVEELARILDGRLVGLLPSLASSQRGAKR